MWEFSDASIEADSSLSAAQKLAFKGLGLTTPGPAIVRINTPADNHKNNGRWFAVFASGPTGPIDTATKQFLGRSDQNLKIYVVDINPFTDSLTTFKKCSGAGATGCNYWVFDTNKPFAFANSLINATVDLDKGDASSNGYWSDDIVYVTYTKASLATTGTQTGYPIAWDKGGVLRLITNNDPDPANWYMSTLIDDIGPITRSVDILQNKLTKKLWVYFGEGRYFFKGDDLTTQRTIYGIADPCYSYDLAHLNKLSTESGNCPTVTLDQLKDQTSTATGTLATTDKGWYINMYTASGSSGAERMTGGISANVNGVVFFTTFVPNSDLCVAGGYPSGWAVNAATGGTPPAASMEGKLILTTSDQPIAKPINIKSLYTLEGNRKMSTTMSQSIKGMPPPQPPPNVVLPQPSKKIINIQER
jgi:type IV pilus assembly protein PilY1